MNIKEKARPMAFLLCIGTLCLLAIFELLGLGEAPKWAMYTLGAYSGEWLLERGIRKGKGGN